MFELPEGLVPEARPVARDLGIQAGDPVEKLLASLLVRRNELILLVLAEQRIHAGALRAELDEAIRGRGREESSAQSLKHLLNQAVVLGTRLSGTVTLDHVALAVLENAPNAATRALEAKGFRVEEALRLARSETKADASKEAPELTARRLARRIEHRARIRFRPAVLNQLWILAEQYLPGPDRNKVIRQFLQTIAAEALAGSLPPELTSLQLLLTEAKVRAQQAEATGGSSTRRRSLEEEIKSREHYLRSLASWLEANPGIEVKDEHVRQAIGTLAKIPIDQVDL